jgi:endo-1,4-beta-D-glucanase Y
MHQSRSALLRFVLPVLCACSHPLRLPPSDGGRTGADAPWTGAGGGREAGGLVIADAATGAGGAASTGGAGSNGAASGGDTIGNGGRTSVGGSTGDGWSGRGGTTSAGGSSGNGGTPMNGSAADAGDNSVCQTDSDMISDFESSPGKATLDSQSGLTGYWYVFFPDSDTSSTLSDGEAISPALVDRNPITTAPAPDPNVCNQFALHSTAKGFPSLGVGFGAFFSPIGPSAGNRYDVSRYSGITFKVKSGSGIPPAVFFEVLTRQSMPATAGGVASAFDLYNTRGQLLNAPWSTSDITSTYQTFTVPFGTLVPRWLPSPRATDYQARAPGVCSASAETKCNAKPLVASDAMGIRVSVYLDGEFPEPEGSISGGYDLWIDDVAFVKGDAGLRTRKGFPLANPGSPEGCSPPRGMSADAKFLVPAYDQWKARFVRDDKVIRPENGNDVLSEGIAFGMLIALNMNDQSLFDGLYGTWKGSPAVGASTLMKSCLGSSGGSTGVACSPSDGSSTGADQDVAYALLMADRLWGGSYKANAIAMLKEIWDKDIDGTGTKLPKGGSQFEAPTGTEPKKMTSASYFAPSYYRAFATADSDASHDWLGVVAAVYGVITGPIAGSNGLIPAWCGKSCTVAASNDGSGGDTYQYDSHRIPMRVGLDYCFNGAAEAKAYADRITAFFANAGRYGVGHLVDMYDPRATEACCNQTTNSASMLGTAAVGAMASGAQTFLDEAYQVVFDIATRGTMAPALIPPFASADRRQPTYSYYNATMAMLTLLIMTGNFMH